MKVLFNAIIPPKIAPKPLKMIEGQNGSYSPKQYAVVDGVYIVWLDPNRPKWFVVDVVKGA